MTLTRCTLWMPVLTLITMPYPSTADSFPKTQRNLNDSAVLSCSVRCSGVTLWKRHGEEVAACGPGAAAGLKFTCTVNGGESTLTIPQVNYSTRGFYSAFCTEKELFHCRQLLQLLTPEAAVEQDAGSHLRVGLQISEPVKIKFRRPGSPSAVQLCRVIGRDSECAGEYRERVLIVGNTFILRSLVASDSGTYTVQEEDGTLVSVLNVTVQGGRSLSTDISGPGENPDLINLFMSSFHGVRQTPTCTEEFGEVALGVGAAMLALGLLLGFFAVPQLLHLINIIRQRIRRSANREPDETVENGDVPLKSSEDVNVEPGR